MKKELVIKIRWGGLGDHLFHSHLPKLAKQQYGYTHVYISTFSNYNHPDTKRLVWDMNPYVDGFVDVDRPEANFAAVPDGKNILDAVSDYYGLIGNHAPLQEPEVYYIPKQIESLNQRNVCEFNHVNSLGVPSALSISKYLASSSIRVDHQIGRFNSAVSAAPLAGTLLPHKTAERESLANIPSLTVTSIEGLCDIIGSCASFFCVISGPATLAAALRRPATVLYVDGALDMFRHSSLHSYVNLTGK